MAVAPTLPSAGDSAALPLDVFISYAREDRGAAQALASALVECGVSVWWDRQIAGGQDFTEVIAERLAAARVVLVLWSQASVLSNFVRDEASRARDAGKLLPVRIQDVRPPLGFGTIHTLDMLDWDGDRGDAGWVEMLANVQRGPGGLAQGLLPGGRWPWRRWRRPLALTGLLMALLLAGTYGWNAWREQQALAQFQEGLSAHFARDRNLQAARNAYLSALSNNPELGRAHYYLAHVYALLILPRDARMRFGLALRYQADLDAAQREDASVQLAALDLKGEAAPVTRDAPPRPGATPVPGAAAQRDPARTAPAEPAAAADAAPRATPGSTGTPASLPRRVELPELPRDRGSASRPAADGALPVAQLPRLPPSPEQQRVIEARVNAMFAPAAQTRLSAATGLALDPGLLSDVLPLAIDRSLSGLAEAPIGEAAAAGASNTLQLLLAASPATLNAQRTAVLRLLDAVEPLGDNPRASAMQLRQLLAKAQAATPPLAYIQIADEAQRALALALGARIRAAGYAVPAIENVGARAPSRSEVRVHGGSAPGWGRWLAKIVGERSGEPVTITTLRSVRPANDTFEIWLDKDLCVSAQRRVPACEP